MQRTILLLCFFISLIAKSQTTSILIPRATVLPIDSVIKTSLIAAINGFLSLKEGPNSLNTFIDKKYFKETSALVDEIKGIDKSARMKDDHFYKPYLLNLTLVDSTKYLMQLAYIGVDGNTPLTRVVIRINITRKDGNFYFSSPLQDNTSTWKTATESRHQIHYKSLYSKKNAALYLKKSDQYDKLIGQKPVTDYYCCDNLQEALQILGVEFKSDYNGRKTGSLTATAPGASLNINGTTTSSFLDFDPHDLWHERLRIFMPADSTYKPVDEGCAYLFGGSWGITWEDIYTRFKTFANEKGIDLLTIYEKNENFNTPGGLPLNTGYVINAVIIKEILSTHDFSKVLILLRSSNKGGDNATFFANLELITGINKTNFNEKIKELLNKK
jgi:hypothetical protein